MAPDDPEDVPRLGRRVGDDVTDDEWKIIEARSLRHDIATNDEVKSLFGKYRGICG